MLAVEEGRPVKEMLDDPRAWAGTGDRAPVATIVEVGVGA
jgi:hypothetical protein